MLQLCSCCIVLFILWIEFWLFALLFNWLEKAVLSMWLKLCIFALDSALHLSTGRADVYARNYVALAGKLQWISDLKCAQQLQPCIAM